MRESSELFSKLMGLYRHEPGLSFSPTAAAEYERLSTRLRRARRCFNLQQVAPQLKDKVGLDSLLLLKEIFDRIDLPPLESAPDAQIVAETSLEQWRIPQTEIVLAKVKEGDRAGEFLFSPQTVDQLPEFYETIRSLPYKPESWEGVYDFYSTIGRHDLIPWKLTDKLPEWTKTRAWGQALWRWIVLSLAIILLFFPLGFIFRWSRGSLSDRAIVRYSRRIAMPVSVSIATRLLGRLLDGINLTGNAYSIITTVLGGISFIAAAWAIVLLGNVLAEIIVTSPRIRARSLDEAVARLSSRILTFVLASLVILYGAHVLGLPVVPLVAGLGVGSLALALAAQPTIENFIAGLTLYADRPARVGDFCRFGDVLGTVEEIGMRSTRIRTLDDTVVSVPNSDFSKSRLENYSARGKFWYHPRIRLHYDTTPDQIRYILVEIRQLLYAHPRCLPDAARIRFTGFGEYSLDLDIFAYIETTNYAEYLEISEDLNLRIMNVITTAGTKLAIPAQVEYRAEEKPFNLEARGHAEATVREWKAGNTLYIPSFPSEKIAELRGSLDYPPEGSPEQRMRYQSEKPGPTTS